jgi:hypothetical protein
LNPFCDQIVPRSENDDNHDRFALHRVNKLRGLRYRSPTDSRRLPKTEKQPESVARFDVTVLSTGKAAAAAVSFGQWRWYATLDRHIVINFEITPRGRGIALFNRVHMAFLDMAFHGYLVKQRSAGVHP